LKKHQIWLKDNLFNTKLNTAITLIILLIFFKLLFPLYNWAIADSVVTGTSQICRQASGACWAFIIQKYEFIIFGFYPEESRFRPIIIFILFVALALFSREPKRWNKKLIYWWTSFFIISSILLRGGIFGLNLIQSSQWGGLVLTLVLATIGMIMAYPLGIILALARRSNLLFFKNLSIIYIELIRGIPLISVLFMSSVMLPLFLPEGVTFDKVLRAQIAIILFISAYMAEVVRAGLAAIPNGQYDAAKSLGLNYFQTMKLIILPQALKTVIPPTLNTVIGMFKDTSLVMIIALFDLMGTTKTSLKDVNWLGFSVEAYIFVALIYFVFSFSMSLLSSKLEKDFSHT
jgi:general L-amino acid transport system permease protein